MPMERVLHTPRIPRNLGSLVAIGLLLLTAGCASIPKRLIGTWKNPKLVMVIHDGVFFTIEREGSLKTGGSYSVADPHHVTFNFPGRMGCIIFDQRGLEISRCNQLDIEFVLSDDVLVFKLPNGDVEWFTK